MDYKKVLRLHFVNHLSCREIAESCGDCSKTTVNEFLKRFRENSELSYPLCNLRRPAATDADLSGRSAEPNGHPC